jgi:hypothetical protein
MTDIATTEPLQLRAGDTWTWSRSLTDYPAGSWTLKYAFKNSTHDIQITAAADGTDHLVTVAMATTAGYTKGRYKWVAYVESATERYTIGTGEVDVLPSYVASGVLDDRTPARKALDALDAGLAQFGSNAHVHSYTIEGRTMQYRTFADFIAARDRLKQEVAREEAGQRAAAGLAGKNRLRVKFR